MPPSCDQTGVPGLVAFAHFHSSTISGSASLMIDRTRLSVSPRQSPSSRIRSSIRVEASIVVSAIGISYVPQLVGVMSARHPGGECSIVPSRRAA
jgi:hypothetical protein